MDSFLLDRGFQALLTAYPEAQLTLDYQALDLQPFEPGALVRCGGKFRTPDTLSSLQGIKQGAAEVAPMLDDSLIPPWSRWDLEIFGIVVPEDHYLRHVASVIPWDDFRDLLAPCSCQAETIR